MPANLFVKSVDLDLLYPPMLEKLLAAKAAAKARGALYLTTEGYRSMDRSEALYTTYKRGGPRAAPPGASGHNFGLCTDEALIIAPSPNRKVSFEPKDYDVLKEELAKVGLLSGGVYGDHPHVDFPGFVTAQQLKPLKEIWDANLDLDLKARLRKIWEYVDQQIQKKVTP